VEAGLESRYLKEWTPVAEVEEGQVDQEPEGAVVVVVGVEEAEEVEHESKPSEGEVEVEEVEEEEVEAEGDQETLATSSILGAQRWTVAAVAVAEGEEVVGVPVQAQTVDVQTAQKQEEVGQEVGAEAVVVGDETGRLGLRPTSPSPPSQPAANE